MSKKANPMVIGIFVVLAVAIAAVAIVVLGSGKLFAETDPYVLYFEGALSGLDVGAPVEYQGVQVGSVTAIKLQYYTDSGDIVIPVYIELEKDRFEYVGSDTVRKGPEYHIKKGLRAQLQSQSLVTGKIMVMLLEQPESPIRIVGRDTSVIEIPTIPTLKESLANSLHDLPLAEIVSNVNTTLYQLASIMSSTATRDAIESLDNTMLNLQEMSASIKRLLEQDSPLRIELSGAIREMSSAAKSFRLLADQLEQHPESLLKGKQPAGR